MIRLAFRYADPRIFARLVCLLQGGDCAHVEIATQWIGQEHRCHSASFLDRGVRTKTISLDPTKWRIYEFDIDAGQVERWFKEHAGEKYDALGLAGFVFRRIKGWKKAWFCTEAVFASFGAKDPYRVDPAVAESFATAFGRKIQ